MKSHQMRTTKPRSGGVDVSPGRKPGVEWLRRSEPRSGGRFDMDSTELQAGYEEMSGDAEHEAEALEWREGLVGDAFFDPDG